VLLKFFAQKLALKTHNNKNMFKKKIPILVKNRNILNGFQSEQLATYASDLQYFKENLLFDKVSHWL